MTTSEFVQLVALRAWQVSPPAAPSNYSVALATNPPDSLDYTATWADIEELSAAANPGYAQVSLTDWAKGQPYEAVAQCAGFENIGDDPWQTANWFCVIADAGGVILCWAEPIDPPVALPAGDHITFPDGVRFSLRDSYA